MADKRGNTEYIIIIVNIVEYYICHHVREVLPLTDQ